MLKTIRKYAITLALFAAGTTGLTTSINELTKSTINAQAEKQRMTLFSQLLPEDRYNNKLLKSCYMLNTPALGKTSHKVYIAMMDNAPVAAIMEVTAPDGYSGNIHLLVGADFKGTVLGSRVTEHHETPGLGDKIELHHSDWMTHFANKIINDDNDKCWAVKKDGGDFDQFTGATITPRAVINAVKRAVVFAETLPFQLNALSPCER